MIKGMTGFGSAQLNNKKFNATIELKSVNHRYLDVNYYLPPGFGGFEDKARQILQGSLSRGRVTVSIKINQNADQKIIVNKDVVRVYLKQINSLKRNFHLKGDVTIADVLKLQGVLETKDNVQLNKASYIELERLLKKALGGLIVMRKREGRSLAKDISKQLREMTAQTGKIYTRAKAILAQKKKRLTDEEFSSFQKNSDINEEVARLKHYIVELKKLMNAKVSVGKKMDFIGQEMQRETNTIGSKMQDKIISNAVISLKSKVEKVREQAQNIE